MYELIVLSLLMRKRMNGYLIAKITNDKIGPWAKISNGTLYPMMNKMAEAGLIERVEESSQPESTRHSSVYAITERGKQRFHQLMMDTSSNLGDYQRIFQHKISYLNYLAPRERLYLLNHYINYCQASILFLQSEAEDLAHLFENMEESSLYSVDTTLDLLQHQAQQWQAELEWTWRLRAKIEAQIETTPVETIQIENETTQPT